MYKQFKASTASPKGSAENGSLGGFGTGELGFDDYAESVGMETQSQLMELSRSLSAFPNQSGAYNDLSGRYSLVLQKQDRSKNLHQSPYASTGSLNTNYVTAERVVCTYIGFFSEKFSDSYGEQSREVHIKLFLEDNSIEIVEPRVENSGGPSGKFLKRHQILRPVSRSGARGTAPQGPLLYTMADFYSGAELQIYDRTYYVIDADTATKHYMQQHGYDFGEARKLPQSVYDPKTRPGMPREPVKSYNAARKKGQKGVLGFFEFDRKVLRFFGAWDCRDTLFGDDLRVKLHYRLSDGSIEIVPMHERNNGRDKVPKFLSRQEIKKPRPDFMSTTATTIDGDSLQGYSQTGIISSGSMLSLLGEGPGVEPAKPYHWTDLKIGEVIPVAAYNIVLLDADEFTRAFYASKDMALEPPIIPPSPVYPEVSDEPPPPLMAMPTKTKEEGIKAAFFMGISLRFRAVFTTPKEADKAREFVIQYFMENDTIQVIEPPIRNSGHKGGLFLARSQPKNLFKPNDLYLGATVRILNHEFSIIDADMATLKFMESYPDSWLFCNVKKVSEKMLVRKHPLKKVICTYPGMQQASIDLPIMEQLFVKAGLKMVKQEVKTVFRVIDPFHTGSVRMSKLLRFVTDL